MAQPLVESPVLERMRTRVEKAKSFTTGLNVEGIRLRYERQLKAMERVMSPRPPGHYMVWSYNVGLGPIADAFDNLTCFGLSGYAYPAGVWGLAGRYVEIADGHGYSRDVCSSVKTQVGVALSGELAPPDAILTGSMWCEGYRAWQYVAEYYKVPIFCIDTPQAYYQQEHAVRAYIHDYEELIEWLEGLTQRKCDWEKFDRAVRLDLEMAEIRREINELRRIVPHPMKGRDAMRLEEGRERGSVDLNSGLIRMRDELKGRVERGEGVVPIEKHRLLWCQTPPFYVDLTGYMEEAHGAIVAFNDPHKHIWWEKGQFDGMPPLEVMARQQVTEDWQGPGERRLDLLIQHARDYKCDGAIFFRHWGARCSSLNGKIFQDRLMDELGIPTLILDEDYIDSSYYSDDEVKSQLDSFIEML